MIIVQLTGGMGNQMFQYAFARYLATKHQAELKLDLSFFKTYEWHEFSLAPLNIHEVIASQEEVRSLKGGYSSFVPKVLFHLRTRFIRLSRVVEPSLEFDQSFLNTPDNSYLEGYWQSDRYFLPIANVIRQEFTVKPEPYGDNKRILEEIMRNPSSVSLHIRRGNYVTVPEVNKIHGLCSIEYYQQAMDLINGRVSDPYYFIFSDDIAWVRENLVLKSAHMFVDKNDDKSDYEDLRLMSHCKHNIIANSTFSWWAAWLNPYAQQIVIAPKKWFNDPTRINTALLPEVWIKI